MSFYLHNVCDVHFEVLEMYIREKATRLRCLRNEHSLDVCVYIVLYDQASLIDNLMSSV